MKKLLFSLLALTVCPAFGAITYQQSVITANASASNTTASFATLPAVGDLVVASAHCEGATACSIAIADNQGNSYTSVYAENGPGASVSWFVVAYTSVTTSSGTFTVTGTMTTATDSTLIIAAYCGVASVSPLDVNNQANGTGTAASVSATTTNANDVLVAVGAVNNFSCTAPTAGSGYTMRQAQGACTSESMGLEDKLVSASGSQTATMTTPSTLWILTMLAFKAAAAATTVTIPKPLWIQ